MQDYQLTKMQRDLIGVIRRLDDVQCQALYISAQILRDTHDKEAAEQAFDAYMKAHGYRVAVTADS